MSAARYDLHCHSSQSDGILSPEELVSRAKANGVSCLALTDHDTYSGLARARKQAGLEGLTLVSGTEISCLWYGRSIHLVLLNFDETNSELVSLVAKQAERREQRSLIIGHKLERLGCHGVLEQARQLAGEAVLGRPHFAQALVDSGRVKDIAQAFKRYLGAGKAGDVSLQWPDIDEVCDAALASGAQAVLAHPLKYKMTRTKLCRLIEDFVECRGAAIEVVSGKQTASQTGDVARLANKFELLASTGSDFHAPSSYAADLGGASLLPSGVEPVWSAWS